MHQGIQALISEMFLEVPHLQIIQIPVHHQTRHRVVLKAPEKAALTPVRILRAAVVEMHLYESFKS